MVLTLSQLVVVFGKCGFVVSCKWAACQSHEAHTAGCIACGCAPWLSCCNLLLTDSPMQLCALCAHPVPHLNSLMVQKDIGSILHSPSWGPYYDGDGHVLTQSTTMCISHTLDLCLSPGPPWIMHGVLVVLLC